MIDLVIFVGIVGLVVVVGVLVGMIVAGRIDRILAPRPAAPPEPDAGAATPGPRVDQPATTDPAQEEQP